MKIIKKNGKIFLRHFDKFPSFDMQIKNGFYLPFSDEIRDYRLYFHLIGSDCPHQSILENKENVNYWWHLLEINPKDSSKKIAHSIAQEINFMMDGMLRPQGQIMKLPSKLADAFKSMAVSEKDFML